MRVLGEYRGYGFFICDRDRASRGYPTQYPAISVNRFFCEDFCPTILYGFSFDYHASREECVKKAHALIDAHIDVIYTFYN